MDYGALPPEINSGRIYAGPGSGSLVSAASAWEQLSTELHSTAAMFDSVTSTLIAGPWTGPTATAMAAAAQPYVTWLRGTGTQAEQTARQAGSAAQAYATAVAAVVPPPLIAANRALLHQLIATNFFGQNSPAIGEAERQYAEMWAQDAAAMYRYASSSAAASALTPFGAPPQTTTASGQLAQSAAVAQAGSAATTNDTAVTLSSIIGQLSPFTGLTTQAMSATMTGWSGTANMLSNVNNGIGLVAFTAENPGGLAEILNPPFLGPAGLGTGRSGAPGSGAGRRGVDRQCGQCAQDRGAVGAARLGDAGHARVGRHSRRDDVSRFRADSGRAGLRRGRAGNGIRRDHAGHPRRPRPGRCDGPRRVAPTHRGAPAAGSRLIRARRGFCAAAPGGQLRTDVHRTGCRTDARGGGGLGRARR